MKTCGKPYHGTLGIVIDCSEETPCRDCLLVEVGRLGYMVQSLQGEIGCLRSAPVAVEVPESFPMDGHDDRLKDVMVYADDPIRGVVEWGTINRMVAWFREHIRPIPSDRVLKDGEREELDILRQVAKLIDDKRNAQWEKRGAGPCQRMPDEIDNLLCDWYEIQAQREFNAIRSQRTENECSNDHAPN